MEMTKESKQELFEKLDEHGVMCLSLQTLISLDEGNYEDLAQISEVLNEYNELKGTNYVLETDVEKLKTSIINEIKMIKENYDGII